MQSDEIFNTMVNATVVHEDMEGAAKLALQYLQARDTEEKEMGFRTTAMQYLHGVDTTELERE